MLAYHLPFVISDLRVLQVSYCKTTLGVETPTLGKMGNFGKNTTSITHKPNAYGLNQSKDRGNIILVSWVEASL